MKRVEKRNSVSIFYRLCSVFSGKELKKSIFILRGSLHQHSLPGWSSWRRLRLFLNLLCEIQSTRKRCPCLHFTWGKQSAQQAGQKFPDDRVSVQHHVTAVTQSLDINQIGYIYIHIKAKRTWQTSSVLASSEKDCQGKQKSIVKSDKMLRKRQEKRPSALDKRGLEWLLWYCKLIKIGTTVPKGCI